MSLRGVNGIMKVAVTGSTGFIGRHVLAELANHPVEVIAIARRLPQGGPHCQDTKTGSVVAQGKFVQMDIQDVSSETFDQIGNPDVLVHLAWGGLPNYRSLHHFEEELLIQYRFLRTLVQSGLGSIVVTGTCFEYGMQSGPLSEDMEARANNPYGFSKDALRRQLEYLRAVHPFSLTWARLFYLYGEGQSENSLFQQLKRAVQHGDKVFNMSGGEQLRDYLPVADVAKYLVALALARKDIGVVNICSGKPISVRELVENWVEENGWAIGLNLGYYPYPDYEPLAFWGTRSKLDSHMELL